MDNSHNYYTAGKVIVWKSHKLSVTKNKKKPNRPTIRTTLQAVHSRGSSAKWFWDHLPMGPSVTPPPLLSALRPKREHNQYLLYLISTTAKVKWCTEILIPDRNITRFSACHCNSNTYRDTKYCAFSWTTYYDPL